MKTLWIGVALLLAGCSSVTEMNRIDQDYGRAARAAWDAQAAGSSARAPEGLAGITAEEIMAVYNGTFAEEPTRQEIFQFNIRKSQ